jgi:hypothetical protein
MPATLEEVDAELARWRERLAAASRNVAELSEVPEYGAARAAASGSGRLAEEARSLAATMDELWQGVLLIGAALDRAEQARRSGSRLWRGEEAAQQAMAILRGPSITVDLADTPVLHRQLLAAARASATVSPDTLLRTMHGAFDRARQQLAGITEATAKADALGRHLAAAVARLPAPGDWAARLEAAARPDALDRLDALTALAPGIEAAAAAAARAQASLAEARAGLAALQAEASAAQAAAAACCADVAVALPPADTAAVAELAAWLERIGRTFASGRVEAAVVGLANWRALHDRVRAECTAIAAAARQATARRDELVARLGALRAKHRARPDPALEPLAAAAKASLAPPADLDAATRAMTVYEAALAGR